MSATQPPQMSSPPSAGVITRYARAWEAGNLAEIVNCYDENIIAHYGGQSAFAGTHQGRDRFFQVLLDTGARSSRRLISIDQIHDNGETGAFFVTESLTINGEEITVPRALRFRTNSVTIVEVWLYDHHQHLIDAAWAQQP
jgi:uncharacterized protein